MSNKILNLDLSKDPIMPAIIYGRVGDDRLQTITVNLTRRDEVADLTGYTITFEGITSDGQTKVFDSDNINPVNLKQGSFDYTFPNMAFAVAGKYEQAYFSFVKDGKRDTSASFEIIVFGNADIDAPEAETLITEYNRLVDELQKLQKESIAELKQQQDEYVLELSQALAKIQTDLVTLEGKIKTYETSINKTATDAQDAIIKAKTDVTTTSTTAQKAIQDTAATATTAVEKTKTDAVTSITTTVTSATKSVNSAKEAVIKAVNDALAKLNAGDFYTKTVADDRFAKSADITKAKAGLGNVDNYGTATQAEAEAGTASNKFMTPIRTSQQIDKRIATQEEVNDGTVNNKYVAPNALKLFMTNNTASNAEVVAGTNNSKFVTSKGVADNYSVFKQGAWVNITLGSDLKAADGTTPRYRVDTLVTGSTIVKHVIFNGAITGSGGTLAGKGSQYIVFTLPESARASQTTMKPLQTNKMTVTCRCATTPNGIFYVGYDGTAPLDYVYLDNMELWI